MKHFIASVQYEKALDNGQTKQVTEQYLVQDETISAAEARVVEELTPFINGEFNVTEMKSKRYAEIILNDEYGTAYFFNIKSEEIIHDDVSGKEKRKTSNTIVRADYVESALHSFEEYYDNAINGYGILSITRTPIIDYYAAKAE